MSAIRFFRNVLLFVFRNQLVLVYEFIGTTIDIVFHHCHMQTFKLTSLSPERKKKELAVSCDSISWRDKTMAALFEKFVRFC